ncbi:MAG: hypothetical protein QOE71_2361 [Pseudonocardiales bacterium]|nr:hypothetical protein [Pseudonocardiales bacterium]
MGNELDVPGNIGDQPVGGQVFHLAKITQVADADSYLPEGRVLAKVNERTQGQQIAERIKACGRPAISGASSGPVRSPRQWRSWPTVAPDSAATILVV